MIDMNKATQAMEELDKKTKGFGTYSLKVGQNRLRIVPNVESPDWPFKDVQLYWGLTKGPFISPASYGQEDPIKKELDLLRRGSPRDVEIAKQLSAKSRIYVPCIVRGEQDKGVLWVDFPKKVYKSILNLITDEEWGDMTDPKKGYDIIIKKTQVGKEFPTYDVIPKPNSKLTSDPEKLEEWLNEQPKFSEALTHYTYEQLEEIWEKYINGSEGEGEEEEEQSEEIQEEEVDIDDKLAQYKKKFKKK